MTIVKYLNRVKIVSSANSYVSQLRDKFSSRFEARHERVQRAVEGGRAEARLAGGVKRGSIRHSERLDGERVHYEKARAASDSS